LFFGKFTGSAIPLLWAHAEYIKLCLSIGRNRVLDMPHETQKRYLQNKTHSDKEIWRLDRPKSILPLGKKLRIEIKKPAKIVWSFNDQRKIKQEAIDTGIGIYYIDIPKQNSPSEITFKIFGSESQTEKNKNYRIKFIKK